MSEEIIEINAVGDIMLGDHPICIGHGVLSKIKKNGNNYPFTKIRDYLNGDINIGNLEAVLSNKNLNNRRLNSASLRSCPEAVEGLKYANFNVLSLANNHALEHGKDALLDTMDILVKNNIQVIGLYYTERSPLIIEKKGIKIAFLAYCLIEQTSAYISTINIDEIISDIKKTKSNCNILVVSLHWGEEYIDFPSKKQIINAKKIIDAGADIIIGHHPHVLQGIEQYNNGIIAYSLGNFIFDNIYIKNTRESMILKIYITKNGIMDYIIFPTYIDNNYISTPINTSNISLLNKKIEYMNNNIDNNIEKTYADIVQKNMAHINKIRYIYFLKHIYRYNVLYIIQMTYNFFIRRVKWK